MLKIFQDAKDKNVKSLVVYGKAADHKLYLESTYTTQVDQADIEEAFKKGMLVIMNSTQALRPFALAANKVVTADLSGAQSAIAGVEWEAKATAQG